MQKMRWQFIVLIMCLALFTLPAVAQETTPAPEETATVAAPEETLPPVPTDVPTEPPPPASPPVEATLEVTAEPPVPPTAPPEVPGLPPEPVLALLVREMFETGELSGWIYGSNWTSVPNESGFGLQVANAADVLQLQRGPFINAAAQVSLNFTGGSVHLSLRQSEAGSYSAALDAAGLVTLYRAGVPVQSVPVVVLPAQWQTLRLSVMDGLLRVAVNGAELIAWQDAAPLPPGLAAVTVYPPADGAPFTAQLDNLFLWVPEADVALYPPPTPTAPPVEPTIPPPVVTAEPPIVTAEPPVVTAEPTAEVTPLVEITAEPTVEPTLLVEVTAEPTTEPTAVVTKEPPAEPTPLIDPVTGKSLVYQEYTPPIGAEVTDHDQPGTARNVGVLPYFDLDVDTVGNGVAGEDTLAQPPCGFNITATVWYKFAPTVTKPYVLTTAGSDFDTILVIYPDNGLGTGPAPKPAPPASPNNTVGCNDDVSTIDRTSRLQISLTAGKTYWIRVGGYNGEAGLLDFAVIDPSVRTLAAPKLISPANAASSSDTTPQFQWTPPLGVAPSFYELQISTASNFATLRYQSPLLTGTSHDLPALNELTPDGVYFWRMRSLNVNRVGGAWSTAFKLTIDTVNPEQPKLTAPLDTVTLTSSRPTLSWQKVNGATKYQVTLTEDGSLTQLIKPGKEIVTSTALALSATVMTDPLQHGKTYVWSVVALDAANNPSIASDPWTFSINLMNAPADGAAVIGTQPTFTWYAGGLTALRYVVEVDDEDTFTAPLLHQSPQQAGISYKLPAGLLTAGNTYYWRLIVLNHPLPAPALNELPIRSFVITTVVPPTVKLLTPANTKPVKDDPVVLTWAAVAVTAPNGPFTYEVQVSTNKTFQTNLVPGGQIVVTDTTANVSGLTNGLTYYWRARALNNVGAPGAWSSPWSFIVDRSGTDAPILKAPLDLAEVNAVRPSLSWNKANGAVRYRVQLQLKGDTTQLLVPAKAETTATSLALSSTTVLPAPLQHGSTYEWYVIAIDAAGNESNHSDTWEFTVNLMKAPAKDASIRTLLPARPVFSWTSAGVIGAIYEVTVSKNEDFGVGPTITFGLTTALSAQAPAGFFDAAGDYFWKLQVNGQPALVDAPTWRFVLSTTLPGAPTLLSPTTGLSFNTSPTLQWKAPLGGPFTYQVQIANNAAFTLDPIIVNAGGVLEFVPINLEDGLTYWWRVRALNADGAAGPWSAYRTFIYDTTAPPAAAIPVLLTPADGAVFTGTLPRFTWRAVTGFSRYEIQLITTGDFDNPPALGFQVKTTSFTPVGPLLYADYRWRVRVLDAAGNPGLWSEPFDLKVVSAATAVPVLNRFEDNTPTLTWTPISWASQYEVQISYNSGFTSLVNGASVIIPGPTPATSYTPDEALANGTYFWRVRAYNPTTLKWGAWSNTGTGSFQVEVP